MDNVSKANWPGWKTVRLIGHGSYGSVYELQRTIGGRTEHAALKIISIPSGKNEIAELRADGYDDESLTQYFEDSKVKIENEYALMADMKGHANIVYCDEIRAIHHEDGFGWDIYIKMELLTSLKEYLSSTITEEQVVKLGQDICKALILCQERSIVHRDIKPENILVARDGNFKLGDFGIAKTMESTTSGTKAGTYEYMAPEIFNNQVYHYGADICSLGLVMYWMLNNRTAPFLPQSSSKPTPSAKDAARKKRFSGEPLPAPVHGSAELKRIVLKACEFDPKKRYTSAAAMLQDLENLNYADERTVSAVCHDDATMLGRSAEQKRLQEEQERLRREQAEWEHQQRVREEQQRQRYTTAGHGIQQNSMAEAGHQQKMWEEQERRRRVLEAREQQLRLEQERLHAEQEQLKKQNKKRSLLPIVILCAIIAVAVFVGYSTVHIWTEGSCTSPATCIICGAEDDAVGHRWEDATCETPKTCSECGKTKGDPLEHVWSAATCTEASRCANCGTAGAAAKGHNWQAATTSAPQTCSVCHATTGSPLKEVFLNELTPSNKLGKIWTLHVDYPSYYVHTPADTSFCWGDDRTPGHTAGVVRDSQGNVYTYGLYIDKNDRPPREYYLDYDLDGKYSTFTAYCAFPEYPISEDTYKSSKSIYIYVDDVLMFSAHERGYDSSRKRISINVEGAQTLKILYSASGGNNEAATLYDAKLG